LGHLGLLRETFTFFFIISCVDGKQLFLKASFIYTPQESTAFPVPISTKLSNVQQKCLRISYADFHTARTINGERTGTYCLAFRIDYSFHWTDSYEIQIYVMVLYGNLLHRNIVQIGSNQLKIGTIPLISSIFRANQVCNIQTRNRIYFSVYDAF